MTSPARKQTSGVQKGVSNEIQVTVTYRLVSDADSRRQGLRDLYARVLRRLELEA